MITQIYTAQSPDEALELGRLGVNHVGITISERGLPGEIDAVAGKEIVAALADSPTRSCALSVETDLDVIGRFATDVRPDILHLCGDTDLVGPDEVAALRRSLAGIEIMTAIAVNGPEAVDTAMSFAPHVDWLILDSVTDEVDGIGAAGFTHDWSVSRAIVEATTVPVILAGGLGPDNVAEAITTVRPAGVDSLTRTNRYHPDGTFLKDLDAVAAFVAKARQAAAGRES